MTMRILVTGAAGFIGFHLSRRLLTQGFTVRGIDIINDYYDPQMKQDRLAILRGFPSFTFDRVDLADTPAMQNIFAEFKPDVVINLAAQAGVRAKIDPRQYIDSNIVGFLNILEGARAHKIKHLIFASSSSVYGGNVKMPLSEDDPVDHPVSLYAATKKSNELMAHTYAHVHGIPCTGLRFFTVYGPWGRPDMAIPRFVHAIYNKIPMDVHNNGDMYRDFTYIDDIVEGIMRLIDKPAQPDPQWGTTPITPDRSFAPFRLYNIGNNNPSNLLDVIKIIEDETGIVGIKNFCPMHPSEVKETRASIDSLNADIGFTPTTSLRDGIRAFVAWYRDYYKIGNGPTT